jgi:glycine dehydrogenase
MVIDLTGMELANASLLDEATAAAEAMATSRRLSKRDSNNVFIDQDCDPQTIAVMQTRAQSLGFDTIIGNPYQQLKNQNFFAILVQYPGSKGEIHILSTLVNTAHKNQALVTVAAD